MPFLFTKIAKFNLYKSESSYTHVKMNKSFEDLSYALNGFLSQDLLNLDSLVYPNKVFVEAVQYDIYGYYDVGLCLCFSN